MSVFFCEYRATGTAIKDFASLTGKLFVISLKESYSARMHLTSFVPVVSGADTCAFIQILTQYVQAMSPETVEASNMGIC